MSRPVEALEVERTYDVDTELGVPDLTGIGLRAVTERIDLEAVYVDTADLRLARARTTLRRRVGGPDEGWHLKRPGVGDARRELHAPLGRSGTRVPKALATQVRALARRSPTAAVATLRTHRVVHHLIDDDGAERAQLCDDTVEGQRHLPGAEPLRWREWELELAPGGDPALFDQVQPLLLAHGAQVSANRSKLARVLGTDQRATGRRDRVRLSPTSSAADVVGAALRDQVDALLGWDPQVRADVPDAVHQMRVTVRRLRSTLHTFGPLLDHTVTDPVRARLKQLGAELGTVRDPEVLASLWQDHTHATSDHVSASTGAAERAADEHVKRLALVLVREQDRARTAAHRVLLRTLETPAYLELLDALVDLAEQPPWTAVAERKARKVLRRRIRTRFRHLRRDINALPRTDRSPGALHAIRKDARALRYAVEVLRPAFGRPAGTLARRLAAVQKALGEHHDRTEAAEVLAAWALTTDGPGPSDGDQFALGRLFAEQHHRAAAAERAFDHAWHRAAKPKRRRWLD